MRKILVVTSLLACAALVLGCPLKKNVGDASADAEPAEAAAVAPAVDDAAAAVATPVNAKNMADVARFPGETAASGADKIEAFTIARTSPKGGSVVSSLPPGTDVTKVAEYQTSLLVTFADPKDASATLLGWIGKEAFTAVVVKHLDGGVRDAAAPDAAAPPLVLDAGAPVNPKTLTCAANSVAVRLGTEPICKKRCTKDADCKGGKAGACGPASTVGGSVAKVCVND